MLSHQKLFSTPTHAANLELWRLFPDKGLPSSEMINQLCPAHLIPPASINQSACPLHIDRFFYFQQSECNWLPNDDLTPFWQQKTKPQTHSLCWGSISSLGGLGGGDTIDDAKHARMSGVCFFFVYLQTHLIRNNIMIPLKKIKPISTC